MLNRYKTYLAQFSRTEDLNKRIYSRNYPSIDLRMPLPFRSITTRTTFPIPVKQQETEKISCPQEVFIPGNDSKTFYLDYASSIDVDSKLKNIDKHLESDANIFNSYVPSSNSDLYLENYNTDIQPQTLQTTNGKKLNSNERFNNHTRQQLKSS
tara:strand:- start:559 stop:1020 length:462 start_codon:yes stop_codon:yes gene_type:complete